MTVEAAKPTGVGPADGEGALRREEVAWACRILAMAGYADLTLGHVSVRGSDGRTVYIKRKGVAPNAVA